MESPSSPKRQKAGDASELEVSTARIDALRSTQDIIPVRLEVAVAEEKLRNLTGLSNFTFALVPELTNVDPQTDEPLDELVAEAVESRPDAVAADHALRASAERLRVAPRLGPLSGCSTRPAGRNTGHEFGPALRMTVPIFNRNQGGIARAEAERDHPTAADKRSTTRS